MTRSHARQTQTWSGISTAVARAILPSTLTAIRTDGVRQIGRAEPPRRGAVRDGSRSHAPHGVPRAGIHGTARRVNAERNVMLKERARIARELHDSVAQTLYAITLTASRALGLLELHGDEDVQRIIGDVVHLANNGQSELRALLTNIRSEPLSAAGLTGALAKLAADVHRRSGLDIRLSHTGEPNVPPSTKDALLLISSEALRNVVKHAGANRVDIVLEVDVRELVLRISDDGHGCGPALTRPDHFGLQSMRERAAALGGMLELVSRVGVGTQIRISIAISARQLSPCTAVPDERLGGFHDNPRSAS